MKLSEFSNKLGLRILTNPSYKDREVSGCYIGDLLSWVMGRAKENDAWITIMNNINIVAVAELSGAACIILCEGVGLTEDVIRKADEEEVVIFCSDKTAYELACTAGKTI